MNARWRHWMVAATTSATVLHYAREAAGQCAMCAQNAQAAGDAGGGLRSLLIGAVILIVPVFGLLSGISVLVWKYRHADGQYSGGSSPRRMSLG